MPVSRWTTACRSYARYLGIQSDEELKVKINDHVPDFSVELHEALLLANENSPEIQNMIRRKLESESNVSYARANAGLKADIYLRFGLTQTADKLGSATRGHWTSSTSA
mgnify:CR=1 FL=1